MLAGMSTLDKAYALNGPADCRKLYADWAESYDAGFARDTDYALPDHVARAFLAEGGAGPVLDVGAGTGLLAQRLRARGFGGQIDALDLSPEMLAQARQKGLYTDLIAADVTQEIPVPRRYAGLISSGTFTHGHVGPEAIDRLEALALPGALFVLAINAGVFGTAGFDRALSRRPDVIFAEVPIYGPANRDAAHAQDRTILALWRQPAQGALPPRR